MAEKFRAPLIAETTVDAPIEKVWQCWTNPADIMHWNNPSSDWHTPEVRNDLRAGGKFLFRMERKDGQSRFDFEGTYDEVKMHRLIRYTLGDGRTSEIRFEGEKPVHITETFVPENTQPLDLQREFCASVLAVFKRYTEAKP